MYGIVVKLFIILQEDDGTALVRLKEIVFNSLRRILKRGDLRCIMLTDEDRADIIV